MESSDGDERPRYIVNHAYACGSCWGRLAYFGGSVRVDGIDTVTLDSLAC